MFDLGQPVVDLIFPADTIKDVFEGINVPPVIGELDATVSEHDVELVGHRSNQGAEKGCCCHFPGLLCRSTKAGGTVDGPEAIQLPLSRLNFSDINVNVADRAGLEPLPGRLFAFDVGQAAGIVPLQTAVRR